MTSDSKRPTRPDADAPESIPVALLERYGARLARFDKEAVIFDQGDPATHFHQVASGRVQMVVTSERGRAFTQGYFSAGQGFGEPPLFSGTAAIEDRSTMNATFVLRDAALEPAFDALWKEAGISGIRGHRSVGGYRASMYNALPIESVQVLVDVMEEFAKKNG